MRIYAIDPATASTRVVESLMPSLQAFCARSFSRREDAEDAAQLAMLEIVKSLGSYRGEASLRSWCWRVSMNVIADHRKRVKRISNVKGTFEENKKTCVLSETSLASFRDNPFHAASTGELCKQVAQAVERLPQGLRDALFLREYQGLTYAEIADALNVPLGTVKSRIAAATVKLAEALQSLREGSA